MLISFHDASTLMQVALLILSQFAVISLGGGVVFLFKLEYKWLKVINMMILLLVNMSFYIVMQLDSRILGESRGQDVDLPCVLILAVTVLSIVYDLVAVLRESKRRKVINSRSIQEAFDELPTGVCFFNGAGLPVLCNISMHEFCFAVCGKDLQFITDMELLFAEGYKPAGQVERVGNVFIFPEGEAWSLEKDENVLINGKRYTQYTVTDVTDLNRKRMELTRENEQLRRAQAELKKLSANVVAVTREEEILNTKMRVHDEMGRCLIEAQKYLMDESGRSIPDSVAHSWKKAVSMLKYSNDTPDEDMLEQVRKTCESVGMNFIQTGKLPSQESAAYLVTCAVRECVTNAVRYAGATDLYAYFSENESENIAIITNNGKAPEKKITEGGGLSTLRRRVEGVAGTMLVESSPRFKLTVIIPKGKDGVL